MTWAPPWPGLNYYLQQLNPKLPTLQQDFQKTAVVANVYGDAGAGSATVIDNVPADQQHHRRRAGQPQCNAAGRHRFGQQRHRHAGAGRERLHRRHSAAAGAAEGGRRLLAGVRLHLDRDLGAVDRFAPIIGGIRPGLFIVIQLPARRARLHLSGEPADRERLRRAELPWPAERSDQAIRRIVVSRTVPGHRQRLRPYPAEHANCSSTRRRRCSSCSTVPTPNGMTLMNQHGTSDQGRHFHGRHAAGRGVLIVVFGEFRFASENSYHATFKDASRLKPGRTFGSPGYRSATSRCQAHTRQHRRRHVRR